MKPQNNDEKLKQICNHADNFFFTDGMDENPNNSSKANNVLTIVKIHYQSSSLER